MVRNRSELGRYLERVVGIHGPSKLYSDPLAEVRRFTAPDDLEVAAFLAAGLAFGRVDRILVNLRDLWTRLDGAPAAAVDGWRGSDRRSLRGFVHRWVTAGDLEEMLAALGRARRKHGSLHRLFLRDYDPHSRDLSGSLSAFVRSLAAEVRLPGRRRPDPSELPRGVRTFLSDPASGSACKRLNLFLRWMVRADDGLDLGLWKPVRPDQLVIPLDTHVARISRYLGLTDRRTVDWKMAVEVTEGLRRLSPSDPVRYDFALSRLGILDECPRRRDPVKCRRCPLVPVCTLGGDGVSGPGPRASR